ncbi:STAS domain-containing protein [Spirillospora sp. NPDC048911]|uniref:STAS domain-containing protein n=1 Tax=Spirillospora sp. NPDC048911 TaxID=3364527 RepID=UPI00371912D0
MLSARGELDLATAGSFRDLLVETIGKGCPNVVVDMSGVTFCDSQGLSALLAGGAACRGHGWRAHPSRSASASGEGPPPYWARPEAAPCRDSEPTRRPLRSPVLSERSP